MKICVFHPRIAETLADKIRTKFPSHDVLAISNVKSEPPDLSEIEVLVLGNDLPAGMLGRMEKLRWIQLMSTGTDQLKRGGAKRKILVSNAGQMPVVPVAEFAMLGVLSFAKQLPNLFQQQQAKEWRLPASDVIQGKLLSIVGFGNIGKAIASRAKAFGMQVHGISRSKILPGNVDRAWSLAELPAAVAMADYLIVCIAFNSETEMLISSSVLAHLKPSAVLINVSRSRIVDYKFLSEMIKKGQLRGAWLDTFDSEPLSRDSEIWNLRGVTISPHSAFYFQDHQNAITELVIENIKRLADGVDPLNLCEPEFS